MKESKPTGDRYAAFRLQFFRFMRAKILIYIFALCPLAQAHAGVCDLLLQEKTVTGVGVLAYIEAQPQLKARILAHPNGAAYLKNLIVNPEQERVPTKTEITNRLTEAEYLAVRGYSGGFSRRINEYCCMPETPLKRLRHWRTARLYGDLVRGLGKLDSLEGAVFRDDDIADEAVRNPYLREGMIIEPKRFWSSSRVRTRQYGGDTPRRATDLTLVVRSKTGRSIEKIGWIFIDYEVLFSNSSRFRVDMVFARVGGSHLVFMTEI